MISIMFELFEPLPVAASFDGLDFLFASLQAFPVEDDDFPVANLPAVRKSTFISFIGVGVAVLQNDVTRGKHFVRLGNEEFMEIFTPEVVFDEKDFVILQPDLKPLFRLAVAKGVFGRDTVCIGQIL